MNKFLKTITICLMIILMLTGCIKKDNDKPKGNVNSPNINTNEEVIKDQMLEVFEFTNTSLIYNEGLSILETKVKNTSNEIAYLKSFKIEVKDKDGALQDVLFGYIGENINPGETRTITSSSEKDLSKAVKIEYTINK